jgi:hypothetical protein
MPRYAPSVTQSFQKLDRKTEPPRVTICTAGEDGNQDHLGGTGTALLGVPQIFFVSAAATALGALGMVYVANPYSRAASASSAHA